MKHASTCPNCGYCPTCGRASYPYGAAGLPYPTPYWYQQPYYGGGGGFSQQQYVYTSTTDGQGVFEHASPTITQTEMT